jgi:hypothetical protein
MNISDPEHLSALSDAVTGNLCLGSITQLLPEANDAGRVGILAIDGVSGDTNLPFGSMKPLMTVGEINQCDENFGEVVSITCFLSADAVASNANLSFTSTITAPLSTLEFLMVWELT